MFVSLVFLSLCCLAEEKKKIYKYTDENGVTHYSETKPNENYEEADLPALSIVPSAPVKATTDNNGESITEADDPSKVVNFEIVSPGDEQNLWGTGLKLTAKVTPLTEAQQQIFQVQFVLDGKKQKPSNQTTQVFENVYRGEHRLQANLLNKFTQKVVKKSKEITFFMHQNTKK